MRTATNSGFRLGRPVRKVILFLCGLILEPDLRFTIKSSA